jgi:hypothetical protein
MKTLANISIVAMFACTAIMCYSIGFMASTMTGAMVFAIGVIGVIAFAGLYAWSIDRASR